MMDNEIILIIILIYIVMFLVYLLPTMIALIKNHPQKVPIILLNIFGGLIGGIGWVGALVWCFIKPAGGDKK